MSSRWKCCACGDSCELTHSAPDVPYGCPYRYEEVKWVEQKKSAKTSYLERAIEISTQPENMEDDSWGDWVNLCGEADKEIEKLRKALNE